ncbi:DUF6314 family protein [Lentibacter sp.]|uniref:DUF6314 family protein n=1 Tax=Lentibacter sp. TaxID=2024994 RepID=UPI003F699CE8
MRVLSDFTGRWALSRRIVPAQGAEARFEGMAAWTAAGAYEERGLLRVAGQPPMQAERRYRWAADLSVYFEDGRFFHQVPPEGGATGHWCDPDQYDVVYDFADWPRWQVRWAVLGPRKNYEMISHYSRE